jgi:hypothetical protein
MIRRMFIVFRAWYFAGIAGVALTVYGANETRLRLNASALPDVVSVADLEQGRRPQQPFVKLDRHFAVYEATVYETRRERIKRAVYPLLSPRHPWLVAWDELRAMYPDQNQIPRGEVPALAPIKVLALTDRFEKPSDIREDGTFENGAIGILYP